MKPTPPLSILRRVKKNKSVRSSHNNSRQTQVKSNLNQAVAQRRKLKAAEHATSDPIQSHIKKRGEMVGRRIRQLQSKLNQNQD